MKKGLLVTTLFAASALLLASCEKGICFEEAKKHCDDNYTSEEAKLFDIEAVTKVSKSSGFFKDMLGIKEGETTDKTSASLGVLTSEEVEEIGDKATYKVDGKKLIVEFTFSVKEFLAQYDIELGEDDEASGTYYTKAVYDDEGYYASTYAKIDNVKFKGTVSVAGVSVSVEGEVSAESTTTFTARPAN